MSRVNSEGFIERLTKFGGKNSHNKGFCKRIWKMNSGFRDWFLVKHAGSKNNHSGQVRLGTVYLPEKYLGKKVRFKVEMIKEIKKEWLDDRNGMFRCGYCDKFMPESMKSKQVGKCKLCSGGD